jgi:hypothetical protein
MCPKNDDPLTTGQNYRSIKITVGATDTSTALTGSIRINFNGQTAILNADGSLNDATICANAFKSMKNVLEATCSIANLHTTTKGAEYTVSFTEWTHVDGENNIFQHDGNPPLSSFTCDISKVTSGNTPTCAITDVTAINVIGK